MGAQNDAGLNEVVFAHFAVMSYFADPIIDVTDKIAQIMTLQSIADLA